MIVECPRCSARYRVEEEVLKDEPTFKCSRCSHVFSYEGPSSFLEDEPPPGATSAAMTGAEPGEERQGEPDEEPEGRPERETEPDVEPEPEPGTPPPAAGTASESLSFAFAATAPRSARSAAARTPHEEDEFVFDDGGRGALEDPEDEAVAVDEPDDEPRFVHGEDELRVEEEPVSRAHRPWLVFLALLALVYANVALYLRNHPEQANAALARVPIAGDILTEDRLLQSRILLEDVAGTYQRIKDERLVFIVSGRAVNTSQQPLKGVQIESTLYGASGEPLETKSIYCGNAMSMKIVKDLSSKEISLLQRLEPPQRFEIRPGESAGFTVVFMVPPEGMREFSARVAGAQKAVS